MHPLFCSFHPLVGWTRTGGSALPNKGILLSSLVASQWRAGEGGGAFSFAAGAGAGWRTPLLAPLPRGTERVATIDRFPPAFSAPLSPPSLHFLSVAEAEKHATEPPALPLQSWGHSLDPPALCCLSPQRRLQEPERQLQQPRPQHFALRTLVALFTTML